MLPPLSSKRRTRFAFLTAGAVLLATRLMTVVPAWAAESATRPNVIFIVLDASRADHFSGYGYPKDTTPRMDRLAAEGAVFLNNFSQGSDTQTSLPRILSSRHYSLKIFQEDRLSWGLRQRTPETVSKMRDAEQAFLPEMLSAAGYRTAIVTDHHWIIPGTELPGCSMNLLLRGRIPLIPFSTARRDGSGNMRQRCRSSCMCTSRHPLSFRRRRWTHGFSMTIPREGGRDPCV